MLAAEGVAQGVDGVTLESEPHVGVDASGDANVGVTQQFLDHDEVSTVLLIISEWRPAETLAVHGTIPSATGSGGDAVWNGLGLRETSCSVTSVL
ncbi:hypothetical protein AB0C68_01465 [Streptomyces tendae]|uniref:hypothetical protein n=1 Tax=Streptomyces tendae TaxID=1932 RepID=UPI0033C1BCD5